MGQVANVIELRAAATALTTSFVPTAGLGIDGKDSVISVLTYQVKDAAGATGIEAQVFLSDDIAAVPATDEDWYQQSREEPETDTGNITRYGVTHIIPLPAGAINDDIFRFDIPLPVGDKRYHLRVRETGAPGTPGLLGVKATVRTLGANG